MSETKDYVFYYGADALPAPKRPTIFALVAKAVGVLLMLIFSIRVAHEVLKATRTSIGDGLYFEGHHRASSSDRIAQTVYYQLNLSQAWRNPGENWNLYSDICC